MSRFTIALAALAAFAFPAAAADNQNLCGARIDIVQKLSTHYKEQPAAVGMVDKNAVLEIFVSNDGTWTIIATGTDGKSCVLSSGEGWESTSLVRGKDA